MTPLPDTGPQPDGTRSAEQWLNAMGEDVGIIKMQLKLSLEEGMSRREIEKCIAQARKEANRLLSDIGRFASEVHGIKK